MKQIDFLPDRIKAHRARRHRLAVQVNLLAICILAMAALGYAFHMRVRTARAELSLLLDHSDAIEKQLDLRKSVEGELADLMIKNRIEEQLGRRVGTLDVLGEMQRVMPKSMALTKLTMETTEVRIPLKSVRTNQSNRPVAGGKKKERVTKRVRLTLTGMAPTDVDVANFIGQLAGSKVFENVNMHYARNVTFRSRSARKFQVSCFVAR